MAYRLGDRSKKRLIGVHPALTNVVYRAILSTSVDFTVLEGVRSYERQKELFAKGASKTMNSRHLTGHAVDLGAWVNGTVSWDWKHYHEIAKAMKGSAELLRVDMDWGGDWKSFPDGPHFQLSWESYPNA